MVKKYNIDYKDVEKMYVKEGYTFAEIADKYECSNNVIRKIAKRHKIISIRGKSKHRKILFQKSSIPITLKDSLLLRKIDKRLNSDECSVLLGTLLGDSYIKRRQNKDSYSYNVYFAHAENQKQYLEWKRKFFKEEIVNDVRTEKRSNNGYAMIKDKECKQQDLSVFSTKTLDLEYIYNLLIRDGEKSITREYLEFLTPLSLSCWYQDDGSFNKQNRVLRIATMCFTQDQNNIIKEYFYENLKMPCFLEKTNCGYGYSLVLTQNSSRKFLKLIYPYRCKMMDYKFALIIDPSETLKVDSFSESMSKEIL